MHQLLGTCSTEGMTPSGLSLLPGLFSRQTGCRSDTSSQVSMDLNVATALGGSSRIASQLSAAGVSGGSQLLEFVKDLVSALEYATSAGSSQATTILDKAGLLHTSVVELDDALDGQPTADTEECQQWLKQLQGYILSLTKQVQGHSAAEAQHCEAASTTSSMDESGSSNSSTAGTSACDTEWRIICQDAADALSRMADQLTGGRSSSDFDSPRTTGSSQGSSKLVARQSRLSYSRYWSKKIAL